IGNGGKPREIPIAPRLIGNRRSNKGRRPLTQAFVISEEKSPVLDDPSANRKAKLVASKWSLRHSRLIGVIGVEDAVLIELKSRAVRLVGAGLRDHGHRDGPVKLRLLAVGVHAKLADGIDRRSNLQSLTQCAWRAAIPGILETSAIDVELSAAPVR